nr:MAG TPA: hypothetical protein [Caudoviricetes sp.]
MVVLADEEGRTAFFVPLRQTAPDGFGHKARTTNIMQTTASIQRTARMRPLTLSTAPVKAWLNAKSEFFSRISGIDVTRKEVVRINLIFMFMGLAAAIAETSLLIAILGIALAGYNVYQLKQEQGDNWITYDDDVEQEGGRA